MSRFKSSRYKSSLFCIALLAELLSFGHHAAFAQTNAEGTAIPHPPPRALAQLQQPAVPADDAAQTAPQGPEQRVALVIGNSNYQNAARLSNPGNDAQSMAQLLNQAGFEVIAATDLTQSEMIKVVQDFSNKVAASGPNTVAMIYYAGHGVQLEGENYLIPIDAKVSSPSELVSDSVRLVDVMATLEAIPSRVRIVVLDACRNNPFPSIVDAGRGLAIVDAPNGSIVGYSTAPGTEAQDGTDGHSPYTSAFLRLAREPNLPIEQLFKRVRLEVNHSTEGEQTPWESSSLTSEFYFFGDTAMAATRAPEHGPIVRAASNLPMRAVRQAYDYVLAEDQPAYYQEFIRMFPSDPLCDRIRVLLGHLLQAAAWHEAVLVNSPVAYRSFYDKYAGGPYALSALKLQAQPKAVPLLQPTHLIVPQQLESTLKFAGASKYNLNIKPGGTFGQLHGNPGAAIGNGAGKIVTMPAPSRVTANGGNIQGDTTGKIQSTQAMPAPSHVTANGGNTPVDTAGKVQSTQDLKGDRSPSRVVDHGPERIVERHPEETVQRPSRIEPRESTRHSFNAGPSPLGRRQPGSMPGRMGRGMMGGGKIGGGLGGGFGSHFAMGGGGGFRR
jgi:Caspase domain